MNLLKVREIIELNIEEAGPKMPPDVKTALIISAEAVNFFVDIRAGLEPDPHHLLPTETED